VAIYPHVFHSSTRTFSLFLFPSSAPPLFLLCPFSAPSLLLLFSSLSSIPIRHPPRLFDNLGQTFDDLLTLSLNMNRHFLVPGEDRHSAG
jgi:hypothetical protein